MKTEEIQLEAEAMLKMKNEGSTMRQIAEVFNKSVGTVSSRIALALSDTDDGTSSLPQRKRVNARQAIEAIYKVATTVGITYMEEEHILQDTYGEVKQHNRKYVRTQVREMAKANNTEAMFVPQWMKSCSKSDTTTPSEAFKCMLEYAHYLHVRVDEAVMDFLIDNKLSIENYKSVKHELVSLAIDTSTNVEQRCQKLNLYANTLDQRMGQMKEERLTIG